MHAVHSRRINTTLLLVRSGIRRGEDAAQALADLPTDQGEPDMEDRLREFYSGGGGIRTLETGQPGLTVFKTVAFNRSATPPGVRSG
jgi:hypothetical protein